MQQDIMSVFDCQEEWPVCLFDFTFKSNCPNFFTFRVQKPLTSFVEDGYFNFTTPTSDMFPSGPVKFLNALDQDDSSGLLVQRHPHLCKFNKFFVERFKKRFIAADTTLLDSEYLKTLFSQEKVLEEARTKFVSDVSVELTT